MAYFDNPDKKAAWEKELEGLGQKQGDKQVKEPSKETAKIIANETTTDKTSAVREEITFEQLMEDAGIACAPESIYTDDEPVLQKENIL